MLTSYSCILKNDTYETHRHWSGNQSFLFYLIISEGSSYTRMKNKDRRYGYRRGRDSLRFKVVENDDGRQTVSSMSNKRVRRYRKKITRYRN